MNSVSDRTRQYPVPGHSRGVDHARRAGHRPRPPSREPDRLLSGMLRPRLSRHRQGRAASRSRVPRTRLVRHRPGSREGEDHRRSRDGTLCRRRTGRDRPGHRSGRIDRGLSGQGPDRPLGRGHVHTRLRPPRLPSRPVDLRRRDLPRRLARIRRPSAGPHGGEPTSCSTRTSTKRSPIRTGRRPSPIPRIRFTRRRSCCRAAENTCYFATVNCASPGSPTTSAIVRPDGTLLELPALRRGRIADRRHRPHHGDRPPRGTLPDVLVIARSDSGW